MSVIGARAAEMRLESFLRDQAARDGVEVIAAQLVGSDASKSRPTILWSLADDRQTIVYRRPESLMVIDVALRPTMPTIEMQLDTISFRSFS